MFKAVYQLNCTECTYKKFNVHVFLTTIIKSQRTKLLLLGNIHQLHVKIILMIMIGWYNCAIALNFTKVHVFKTHHVWWEPPQSQWPGCPQTGRSVPGFHHAIICRPVKIKQKNLKRIPQQSLECHEIYVTIQIHKKLIAFLHLPE